MKIEEPTSLPRPQQEARKKRWQNLTTGYLTRGSPFSVSYTLEKNHIYYLAFLGYHIKIFWHNIHITTITYIRV